MVESKSKKLAGFKSITGTILCESGLMIGGTGGVIEIGGVDNQIIRNPITKEPYIPGSSLKGKTRSLLELELGKVEPDTGAPHKYKSSICDNEPCPICQLFGAAADSNSKLGPGRLIFRDCQLTSASRSQLEALNQKEGTNYSELKTEVSINRWSAKTSGLRTMERVPASAEFEFTLNVRLFEGDNEDKMIEYIKKGLRLIQQDALGGSGSRGYGKVQFRELKLDGKSF